MVSGSSCWSWPVFFAWQQDFTQVRTWEALLNLNLNLKEAFKPCWLVNCMYPWYLCGPGRLTPHLKTVPAVVLLQLLSGWRTT